MAWTWDECWEWLVPFDTQDGEMYYIADGDVPYPVVEFLNTSIPIAERTAPTTNP